jgi:magnesium-transporting ATPase (P-type)
VCFVSDRSRAAAQTLVSRLVGDDEPTVLTRADMHDDLTIERILHNGEAVVLGTEFTPAACLHLVKMLQQRGTCVCVYGKHVYSVPMLSRADLGVSAPFCTDMARYACDIVVLDGFTFAHLVSAFIHVRHRDDLHRSCSLQ